VSALRGVSFQLERKGDRGIRKKPSGRRERQSGLRAVSASTARRGICEQKGKKIGSRTMPCKADSNHDATSQWKNRHDVSEAAGNGKK